MKKRRYGLCDDDDDQQMSIPIILNTSGGGDSSSMFNPFASIPTDNHIYFYDDVETETILTLNKNIRELNTMIKEKFSKYDEVVNYKNVPIYLHINSHGGDLFAGLSAVDTILNSECPIYTIVEGAAASAATFLSVCGKKRFMTKHSFILIHQLTSKAWGTYEELKDDMKNNEMFMSLIKNIYKERTNRTMEQLDEMLKHDIWIDANKAIEFGLVDEVL